MRAAVDAQDLPGHKLTEWPSEEIDHTGDFVHKGNPVQCAFRHEPVFWNVSRAEEPTCPRIAGGQAVYVDVVRPQLRGEASRVFHHRGFGRRVNDRGFVPLEGAMELIVMIRPVFRGIITFAAC